MIALLNTSFSIHLEAFRVGHYVIFVIEAIVVNIMAKCRDDKGNSVEVIEHCVFGHVLGPQDVVAMLSHIGPVKVVVVLYLLVVSVVYLNYEVKILSLV